MSSPTFDGKKLFDSTDSDGNSYSEGVLDVLDYSGILQPLHFNGEDGMRYLGHGWGDRQWVYRGVLTAPSAAALMSKLSDIEGYIDDAQDGNYKALVSSFGDSYPKAQVHKLARTPMHIARDGYLCEITVTGVIQGMLHEGA